MAYDNSRVDTLMSIDGWVLESKAKPPTHTTGYLSYVKHVCDGEKEVRSVYVHPVLSKFCWRCTAPVPDDIRALWILHNWEVIEGGSLT